MLVSRRGGGSRAQAGGSELERLLLLWQRYEFPAKSALGLSPMPLDAPWRSHPSRWHRTRDLRGKSCSGISKASIYRANVNKLCVLRTETWWARDRRKVRNLIWRQELCSSYVGRGNVCRHWHGRLARLLDVIDVAVATGWNVLISVKSVWTGLSRKKSNDSECVDTSCHPRTTFRVIYPNFGLLARLYGFN